MHDVTRASLANEIEERMGVCPEFFRQAESVQSMAQLWHQAKTLYLDNPLPSLLKEKIFTYLSRYCRTSYCVARHSGFLLGAGFVSGDSACASITPGELLDLLSRPLITGSDLEIHLQNLSSIATVNAWPQDPVKAEALETALLYCSGPVFLRNADAGRITTSLRRVLGGKWFDSLMTLLAFIRTAHFWTETHPEIRPERDVEELLQNIPQLRDVIAAFRDKNADLSSERSDDAACFRNSEADESRSGISLISEYISAKQAVEKELRDSESRYRLFVDQTLDGTYRLDFVPPIVPDQPEDDLIRQMYERGVIGDCNESFARMYGYEPADMVGMRLESLHGGGDIGENMEAMRDFIRNDFQHINIETTEVGKDGQLVYLLNNSRGTLNNGLYDCCWGTQTDITYRKEAEQKLSESEARLQLAAEIADVGIFEHDHLTDVIQMSSEFAGHHGFENVSQLPAAEIVAAIHPDDRDKVLAALNRAHDPADGGFYELEHRIVHTDGSTRWLRAHARTFFEGSGTSRRAVRTVGTTFELTAQLEAREKLRREHELSENVITTAPNIVLVLDTEDRVVRINPYMEELTGWNLHDVQGRDWFDTFCPRDREQIKALFNSALCEQNLTGIVTTIATRSGNEREIEWHNAPLTNVDGKVTGLLCTGQDITDRKAMELHVLNAAADEQRRIAQDLHDGVGQQLNGLSMIADALSKSILPASARSASEGDSPQEIAVALSSGLRTALNEMRSLARGLYPVEIDPAGLASSMEDMGAQLAKVYNMVFEVSVPPSLRFQNSQTPTQLYRIAQEAITNAVRHGKATTVRIQVHKENDALVMRIVDNGSGIPDEVARDRGLGLRTMSYRSRLIGAHLTIQRQPEGGTVVGCRLSTGGSFPGKPAIAPPKIHKTN